MKHLLLLIVLLSAACHSNLKSDDKSTTLFSSYLKSTFNIPIGSRQHAYLIIPKLACRGCVHKLLDDFIADKIDPSGISVITSIPELVPEKVQTDYHFMVDTKGRLDNINLRIQNVAVLVTRNEKVVYLKSLLITDTLRISDLLEMNGK